MTLFKRATIPILISTLLLSCATPEPRHSLTEIPGYDSKAANDNWLPIQAVHAQYLMLIRAIGMLREMDIELSDEQKKTALTQVDKYYFYSSAATIELFYGDYPASRASTSKAEVALMTLGKIVREVIEANNV